jgi:hypothetical protein
MLEAQNQAPSASGALSAAPPPPPVTTEERRRQVAARIEHAVSAHRQDPPDPSWGPSAAASFRTDLEQIATSDGFRVKSIDCRTTQCLAVVEWPSFAQAREQGGDLAHFPYAVNCARHVLQIPPQRLDVPSETTIAFDCTEARTSGTASR